MIMQMYYGNQIIWTQLGLDINPHWVGVLESLKRGGGKWPTKENQLYRIYLRIESNIKHIKGLP